MAWHQVITEEKWFMENKTSKAGSWLATSLFCVPYILFRLPALRMPNTHTLNSNSFNPNVAPWINSCVTWSRSSHLQKAPVWPHQALGRHQDKSHYNRVLTHTQSNEKLTKMFWFGNFSVSCKTTPTPSHLTVKVTMT